MSKKKEHHEEHADESWLIPYADLLTLLLALFIVLFATSQVDSKKFSEMKKAFGSVFAGGSGAIGAGGMDVFGSGSKTQESINMADYIHINQLSEITVSTSETTADTSPSGSGEGNGGNGIPLGQRLEELQAKFDKYITEHELNGKLHTEVSSETVMIIISDVVLFDSGSASIKTGFYETIHAIGSILADNPDLEVQILGHTDNIPILNGYFATNWDLSSARALNFMKELLQDTRLNPQYYSAIGFGEYRPVASNNTESGRSLNRRVEVTARFYR